MSIDSPPQDFSRAAERLRRTLAAVAEATPAPDRSAELTARLDAAGPPALMAQRPDPDRRAPRLAIAAAAVVVLVAATGAGVVALRDRDRDASSDVTTGVRSREADLAPVVASQALVDALRDEATVTSATVVGVQDAIEQPVQDTATARRATDSALVDLTSSLSTTTDAVAHYDPVLDLDLDTLDGLQALRDEVDTRPVEPAKLVALPYASGVVDRYQAMIDALLDADTSYITTTVDDPEVLSGLQLSGEANHQLVLVPQVVPIVALGVGMVVDPDQPGTLAPQDVAALVDDLETGRAAVVDLAAGSDHQDAVGELDAALTAAGLDRLAREALDTGAADVFGLATAADEATAAWLSFLDEIQGQLLEAIQEG